MFTAVSLLVVGTFVGVVLRRLKSDINQENEFRAKLSNIPRNFLQQS